MNELVNWMSKSVYYRIRQNISNMQESEKEGIQKKRKKIYMLGASKTAIQIHQLQWRERCADSFHGRRRSDYVPWTFTSANGGRRIANSLGVFILALCQLGQGSSWKGLEERRKEGKNKVF